MERPLIVMTPKSLLRLPAAASTVEDLTSGGFKPLIDDSELQDAAAVEKIVMCSGKVYYDLIEARKKAEEKRVAILRLEQFYPFPLAAVREAFTRYSNAKQLTWVQEEPQNMTLTFLTTLSRRLTKQRLLMVGISTGTTQVCYRDIKSRWPCRKNFSLVHSPAKSVSSPPCHSSSSFSSC